MGVQGLTNFLKTRYPNYVTTKSLQGIKRIALDGNQYMNSSLKMQYKLMLENLTDPLEDWTEEQENSLRREWLKDCFRFSIKWLEMGITPIWCIDGKSSSF